jgi:hypothetical protein
MLLRVVLVTINVSEDRYENLKSFKVLFVDVVAIVITASTTNLSSCNEPYEVHMHWLPTFRWLRDTNKFVWTVTISLSRETEIYSFYCKKRLNSDFVITSEFRNWPHGAELFTRGRHLCSHSRTSQHFMEREGLFASSKESPLVPLLSLISIQPTEPHIISSTSILMLSIR